MLNQIWKNFSNAQQLLMNQEEMKKVVSSISASTWNEIVETSDMMEVLWRLAVGKPVSKQERESAYEQAKDLAKTVPAFGIFLLPGGMILLPVLAKILPWNLIPSSFKNNKEKDDK